MDIFKEEWKRDLEKQIDKYKPYWGSDRFLIGLGFVVAAILFVMLFWEPVYACITGNIYKVAILGCNL